MPAGEGRARRRTAKVVNYAKEQEFSDEDVFEDVHDREERLERQQQREHHRRTNAAKRKSAGTALSTSVVADDNTLDDHHGSSGSGPPPSHLPSSSLEDSSEFPDDDPQDEDEGPPKPIHVEKGYDPTLLPLRERFTFMPEFEPDGSPKIELIVGRRPREETNTGLTKDNDDNDNDNDNEDEDDNNDEDHDNNEDKEEDHEDHSDSDDDDDNKPRKRGRPRRGRRSKRSTSNTTKSSPPKKKKTTSTKKPSSSASSSSHDTNKEDPLVEYEYLVKYKGKSYLHLEWKSGADLESMNKSAKTLYRRFLKKIASGQEDDIEDPDFDPSFAQPQKIVDESNKERSVELTDKELVEWEKEREEELAAEEEEEEAEEEKKRQEEEEAKAKEKEKEAQRQKQEQQDSPTPNGKEPSDQDAMNVEDDEEDSNIDMSTYTMEKLRALLIKDGPYYPVFDNCDNPYRDGYITTPPKKPRASYLFYQGCMRSKFQKKFPHATTGEIMTMLGDTWRNMTDEQQLPFIVLAKEEQEQFEKERQMMEKAQKPSEMWQPLRRCLQVLDRLVADGFANIFLEPVDLDDFPDYEEIVDTPMDLGTVRTKLTNRKYQAPENFARDVRKVWNNCKIYNQHGSAIWHVADYMSKQFERLYHAWVLEFRERYLRWVNPKARPWEHTCRQHDGSCGTPDDKMIVCDHCDAMYGMACLNPPLTKIPKGIWHCPDCKPKLASVKGVRMLSAVSEQAARKRAELGDTPKKRIKQKMYLVKWAGLGYEFCTWETREDVDDDALIEQYHRLNNTTPDEPDVPEEEINKIFEKTKHLNTAAVRDLGVQQQQSRVRALKNQLYAQTRGLQFTRFGMDIPPLLSSECGPKTKATSMTPATPDLCSVCSSSSSSTSDDMMDVEKTSNATSVTADEATSSNDPKVKVEDIVSSGDISTALIATKKKKKMNHPKEVVECVTDMVFRVSRNPGGYARHIMKINKKLPPLLTGEYDAAIPITSKGLMMNVGEIHGSVAFLGYRSFPDGTKGPAEVNKLIRNVGDKIIAVDGVSTIDKSFKEVILLLRESGKNKMAFMRFLENKYSVCMSDLTSVGNTGRYAVEELQKKFSTDRQRLLVQRRQQTAEEEYQNNVEEESDGSVGPGNSSDEDGSDEEVSEGEFEPEDSDDEDLISKMGNEKIDLPPPVEDPGSGSDEEESSSPTGTKGSSGAVTDTTKLLTDGGPQTEIKDRNDKENASTGNGGQVATTGAGDAGTPGGADADASLEEGTPQGVVVSEKAVIIRPETTRSLAYRLLDVDIGYSSDEGGDEDCAYFLDGVDDTFTTMNEVEQMLVETAPKEVDEDDDEEVGKSAKGKLPKGKGKTAPNESKKKDTATSEEKAVPVKRNDFSTLGDGGKLSVAVSMTSQEPNADDFDKFPFPSSKEEAKKKAELEAIEAEKAANAASMEAKADLSNPEKPVKRSTVKVEQVNTNTNEIIRIWASAEDAAATLQISLNEIKQMLKGDYDEDLGDEVGGYTWRYALAGAEVTATGGNTSKGSKKGKEAFLEFRDKLYDHNDPHDYKNGNKLRDYQIDGVNWLASTWYKKYSCILADEMGLGKTVQIVSYIEHLFRVEKIKRPYLVVVPLSTVEHWRREFQGWTDMVCCVYHDRQRVWRDVMREYEWYYADRPHNADYLKFDVLVTTYDTLIGDFDIIGQIPWRVAVVDEAHRLRNVKGKLLECMKEISALGTLQYGFQSRVLMTGTPLQNNTEELWTLLNFIEPYKFPSLEEFQTNFGNMANREQVEALQRKISPYMLRRVKEDVAKDIPAKEETVIDVELTSIQKQYYRAIFEHNHSFLSMGATRANAPKLMNIQMELRKCCNHPFLLDGVEQRETDKHYKELIENGMFDSSNAEEQQLKLNENGYIQTSGKMVLLDKLLPKLRQEGHKVLIFSQMVKMLDLISEYCDFRNFRHERLDGRVRGTERQKAIDRFETEEDSFVFLLSTRAGGVGINLTAADICIIFDSDWNPQNDVQAQARCHRIGQTKDVMVYRLVTSRTFEQEMFDRASKKLGLEQAVLGTFNQEDESDKPTSKEMEQLLKKGAYALIEDENDEMGKQFCSDDIEDILAKRTRTRVVEGAKTATWLNKQGMNVSKSKFTGDSAAATADVDVDDPMFWQKVMPDFVTPEIMLTKLNELNELVTGPASGKRPGRKKKVQPAPENTTEGSKEGGKKDSETDLEKKDDPKEVDKKEDPTGDDEKKDNKENPDKKAENTEGNENENKEKETDGNENENQTAITSAQQLTRTAQRKVGKFMADLKSMMDGVFEEAEDDSLPASEKATCQKLLLTISIKESLFNEEQRHTARVMLKKLEGDRRRRCRVTGEKPARKKRSNAGSRVPEDDGSNVRQELLILSKHQQKKRRQKPRSVDGDRRGRKKGSDEDLDEDGYLRHSDSEGDWSDVGEDIYKAKVQRPSISRKEAKRRRAWASDKDAATAAGRPWPAFPRNVVSKVLSTILDEVIKFDASKGGIFSVPVPKDEFPEYYEQIKTPMDYGTMKRKLENGEYRSAQSMQKDFVLVMSNCLQFNSPDSDIVQEARQQALKRPDILREAAMKHNLFLAEDGSVLEVTDDADGAAKKEGKTKEKRKRRKRKTSHDDNEEETPKKKKRSRKRESDGEGSDFDSAAEEDAQVADEEEVATKKPRIKISLSVGADAEENTNKEDEDAVKPKKRKVKKRKRVKRDDKEPSDDFDDAIDEPKIKIKRKRRKKEGKDSDVKPEKVKRKRRVKIAPSENANSKISNEKDAGGESDDSAIMPSSFKEASKPESDAEPTEDASNIWLDVNLFKEEREALDDSFLAARENFTKRGPWEYPASLEGKKCKDVLTQTLNKMDRLDHYSVFAEEVTEDEAPGYFDIVKKPMDFGTMKEKIDNGDYGSGSSATAAFYEDFMLVFDNCILYNDDGGEVAEEAARLFRHLPETYASACSGLVGKRKNPKVRS